MIPNKVKITGYKRFKDTSVYLNRKLIAFVGPNEAGKSSFFQALLSLGNSEPYLKNELTRGVTFDEKDCIVRVEYLLEDKEKELVEKYNGIGKPRFYCLWKTVNGERTHDIIGEVKRNKKHRKELLVLLIKILNNTKLKKYLENNNIVTTEGESHTLKLLLTQLKDSLNTESENLEAGVFEIIESVNSFLINTIEGENQTIKKVANKLIESFTEFNNFEGGDHPKSKLLDYFDHNCPEFIFFGNQDRLLQGSYELEKIKDPPPALSNLFDLAGINIKKLNEAFKDQNVGDRYKIMEDANKKLKEEYVKSWSQSEIYPVLVLDPDSIKIQVSFINSYTEIYERSDGLRQYIALKAFVAANSDEVEPVLLIDEAEIHLHYAAQADLVMEFEKQNIANSIIYTTHSAGCLPSDLGTDIRVVEPLYENGNDSGISKINNSIWQNAGGFSPLLLAMGANIFSFTLARKAVIAEGPTETIILPRLLREANGLEYLEFQVAPGIATISKERANSFEFEAAKVAYLVDGDKGGKENRKKLVKGGVEQKKIVSLPEGHSLEDLVKSEILKDAFMEELNKADKLIPEIKLKDIPRTGKMTWFEKLCTQNGFSLPSKVKMAENILKAPNDQKIIDLNKSQKLVALYEKIISVLGN